MNYTLAWNCHCQCNCVLRSCSHKKVKNWTSPRCIIQHIHNLVTAYTIGCPLEKYILRKEIENSCLTWLIVFSFTKSKLELSSHHYFVFNNYHKMIIRCFMWGCNIHHHVCVNIVDIKGGYVWWNPIYQKSFPLCFSLAKLTKLEILDMRDNAFGTLPAIVCSMTSLKEMDLQSCLLKDLPAR